MSVLRIADEVVVVVVEVCEAVTGYLAGESWDGMDAWEIW